MDTKLIIYLDQNHWNRLEKVYYEKINDSLAQKVLDKLVELKSQNKIKIVLDLQRAIETAQRKYKESRKDISNLMLSLSDERFTIPWVYLQNFEIENYFLQKQGKYKYNFRELSIGKGFSYMMGETPEIVSDSTSKKNLSTINEKLRELYPKLMKIQFERYKKKDIQNQNEQVKRAEDARKILFKMDSDKIRKEYQIEQDFIVLMRKIVKFFKSIDDLRAEITDLEALKIEMLIKKSIPKDLKNNKDRLKFMREFPLFYIHSALVNARDRNLDRKIVSNDLIDIVSYLVPIAYLDVVVGENYFIALAKQEKLDKLFGCKLFSKMDDFYAFL